MRAQLEQEIQTLGLADQVSLPGNLDNLQDVMQAADLLAMPSLWEGLPLTLLEAMACGLPIVGTSIPGLVDVVTDGQEGFLVPPEDPVAFASALDKMVRNPDERAEMGRRARRLVEERYSFKRVYAELVEIYRQVMAS